MAQNIYATCGYCNRLHVLKSKLYKSVESWTHFHPFSFIKESISWYYDIVV